MSPEQLLSDQVLITRESADVGHPGRVYVTGPHFGPDTGIFSSTRDRGKADRYQRWQAERLIARHWRGRAAQIEEDARP